MTALATVPLPQHLAALQLANEVKAARAALKHRVTEGSTTVADVLLDVPAEAANMAIGELLICQRRWGARRVGQVLEDLGMAERKTLASMTERQRLALVAVL